MRQTRTNRKLLSEIALIRGELHALVLAGRRVAASLETPPLRDALVVFVTIGVEAKLFATPLPPTQPPRRSCPMIQFPSQVAKPDGSAYTTTEQATVKVEFMKNGRPQSVDPNNPPKFEIAGEAMGAEVRNVEFTGNAVTAKFRPADTAGQCQILMTADPKMGDGVTEFSILFDFAWIDDEADNATITFGVEPKEA